MRIRIGVLFATTLGLIGPGAAAFGQAELSKYQSAYSQISQDLNGLKLISKLLDAAVAEQGPEATIADIRLAKAKLAVSLDQPVSIVLDTLLPLIKDPTPLVQLDSSGFKFSETIRLYCDALECAGIDAIHRTAIIDQALADLGEAMGFTDRSRLIVEARLRLTGSEIATAENDFNAAVRWLKPSLEHAESLSADPSGTLVLQILVGQQSRFLILLGRLDDCEKLIESTVALINSSPGLKEPDRLSHVARILSLLLFNLQDHLDEPYADRVLQSALDHWKKLENYSPGESLTVPLDGLGIGRWAAAYASKRDFDQTTKVLDRISQQFDRCPALVKNGFAVSISIESWRTLLYHLRKTADPRLESQCEKQRQFIDKLESLGANKDITASYREELKQFVPANDNSDPGRLR